jgi:WD40 repeat protein
LAIALPLFQAKIFNMNTKREITSIEHTQSVHTVLFDSSGKYLITRAIDNIIRIFDIRTHQKVASFSPKNTILSMCVGLSKNLIAIGTNGDNEARIFAPHTTWTLEQILLKRILNTWLLVEKPNKNITSSKKLLKDIAAKFQLQKEELHTVWNSFPLTMQAALWRSMHDKIERYGKKIENCIVS